MRSPADLVMMGIVGLLFLGAAVILTLLACIVPRI